MPCLPWNRLMCAFHFAACWTVTKGLQCRACTPTATQYFSSRHRAGQGAPGPTQLNDIDRRVSELKVRHLALGVLATKRMPVLLAFLLTAWFACTCETQPGTAGTVQGGYVCTSCPDERPQAFTH
jgi:hypothetical protein